MFGGSVDCLHLISNYPCSPQQKKTEPWWGQTEKEHVPCVFPLGLGSARASKVSPVHCQPVMSLHVIGPSQASWFCFGLRGKINVLFLCFGAFSLGTYKTGLWRLKSNARRASQTKMSPAVLARPSTSFSNTFCFSITSHSFTVA